MRDTLNPKSFSYCVSDVEQLWRIYSDKKLPLTTLTMEDMNTCTELATLLANKNKRTASIIAWAGARHSRSPGDTIDILLQMKEKGVDPDQKLEETFKGYGHGSVADMARMAVQFNNVPMHLPAIVFNEGYMVSGQEKSTRFQSGFKGAVLHPLELYIPNASDSLKNKYAELGAISLKNFGEMGHIMKKVFTEYFAPTTKEEINSLNSRVLDTARSFLLLGQNTGFAYEASARDWAKLISKLKASETKYYVFVGEQLEHFLAPDKIVEEVLDFKAEAPSLIKHTQPDNTTKEVLKNVKTFLVKNKFYDTVKIYRGLTDEVPQRVTGFPNSWDEVHRMVEQYVLSVVPGANRHEVERWISDLPKNEPLKLSEIIFGPHSHHQELPPQLASTTSNSVIFECSLGELRDFNRHRAWGRLLQHLPLFYGPKLDEDQALQILSTGYTLPEYLREKVFEKEKEDMLRRLAGYQHRAYDFFRMASSETDNFSFIVNILPLAHHSHIWMHGNPKQDHYMTRLRVRPGGHINYRKLTYDAARMLSEKNIFLDALCFEGYRPNALDRDEFFGRS